jgi:hypothetical protein
MICSNRSLYRRQGDCCCRLNPFTAGQGSGGGSLRSSSGGEFLRHHAPALRISSSAASVYPRQAHGDHPLGVKSELPRISPKFP